MSESDGEHVARSLALEQAYVHEVYEQCAASTVQSRHWPRIYQFLEDLEPGALVCDVGCGNGKYLNVKHSVFSVGVDRCKKLTDIAREKENEVLVCDNLSLPFRDESFDAVLSIAVVHHFSTTERRVRALKELARVLRIGGRLIISVWAMEQKHRKFESQDVLIPWPKAYCFDSTSNPTRFPDKYSSCYSQTHGHVLSSQRRNQQKYRKKSYWVDPIYSPSPSTSSLSSPNETCYSFFRRALQKLAGGRRGSRAWFLENWQNSKGHKHYECEDADIENIPIELRRLENSSVMIDKQPDNLSIKSKSLGDILEIQRLDLVRSRSSIPGLCSTVTSELYLDSQSTESFSLGSKPKLVKQKSHLNDDSLEILQNTAMQNLLSDLPDFQNSSEGFAKRANVHKQSSMNEELMFIGRLKEKERVKQNIMKQTSLNEEIMCERTFDKFKDTFYYANATKRFQLLTSGLTNKIKQSTTSIEKVSGMSIKNGFVKIFQSWKSTESPTQGDQQSKVSEDSKLMPKRDEDNLERRLSREDGSDSSKDSSLQSDTSVDSEDSFASVIFVPKPQSTQSSSTTTSTFLIDSSAHPAFQLLSTASAPPSPRIKYPPELAASKMKLIGVSPLLKQFPATSKSLPPPSPPGLSPHTISSAPLRPFFNYNNAKEMWNSDERIRPKNFTASDFYTHQNKLSSDKVDQGHQEESVPQPEKVPEIVEDTPSEVVEPAEVETAEVQVKSTSAESINEEESRKTRLNQIKELLKQKPEFATRTHKLSFPLVRRASSALPGRLETVTKVLPRLLSLELFNPETDDLDSDSSGVSSPESIGSVISVISDERYLSKKENSQKEEQPVVQADEKSEPELVPKVESPSTESRKTTGELSPDESSTWSEECRQHLIDVTEKLGENLIYDINQYCQKSQLEYMDESFGDKKLEKGSSELEEISSLDSVKSCKYSASESLKSEMGRSEDSKTRTHSVRNKKELERRSTFDDGLYLQDQKKGKGTDEEKHYLRYRNSVESSDIGDSIENTISEEESSMNMTGRTGNASTASLASSSIDFSTSSRSSNENKHQRHLERIPSRITELKNLERSMSGGSSVTLSNSSSQESLSSDQEGAITYHQYYHVFREGELDQLINKYVENLHIISSYYDHASWCIVAEKVQVWTI